MPILMNKGADPRQAAWIFYSTRADLETLGQAIVEGRFDAGKLACDAEDVGSAKKASSEVPVYLEVSQLVPEDFDLEAARGEVMERAQAALARAEEAAEDAVEEGAGENGEEDDPYDYDPVPAPAGLRVRVGTTTRQAAQDFILAAQAAEAEEDEEAESAEAELPGLQMLGQLIDFMRDAPSGLPGAAVWHIDEQGILRMAGAKKVKAVSGNTLSVK